MTEPTCRSCWLSTLAPSERERIAAEPVTMPVHLCPEHQAAWDRVMAKFPAKLTIQERVERSSLGTPAARAARASVSNERARRVVARAEEIRQEKGGTTQHKPTCTICREALDASSRVTELAARNGRPTTPSIWTATASTYRRQWHVWPNCSARRSTQEAPCSPSPNRPIRGFDDRQ